MRPNIGSLFSGYGGLEEGVRSVLGGTVAWHSDIDPGACKILAHRYPGVPNLGDITTVNWSQVEPVDVLTGGSPCQDVSAAGKRLGMRAGTRSGLWASMCDAIDIIRPSLVVWENVRGVLSAGADSSVEPCPICVGDERESHLRALGRVVGDLAELGYVGRWTGLRAADVGAPHGRFRIFVVAWDASGAARGGSQLRDLRARPVAAAEPREPVGSSTPHAANDRREWRGCAWHGRSGSPNHGGPASDTEGQRRREGWAESARLIGRPDAAVGGDAPADADGDGLEGVGRLHAVGRDADGRSGADEDGDPGERSATAYADDWGRQVQANDAGAARRTGSQGAGEEPESRRLASGTGSSSAVAWGQYEPAIRRWERLTRPAPNPTEPGRNGQPRLSPAFVEWMQGLPAGWVTDVPGLTRNEQLKALGNGVVPQQCAAALDYLRGRESA